MSLPTTRFTRLVGCRLPIQLAGMPRTSVPDLVAAVTNAGGLRMLGGARPAPAQLAADLDGLALSADGPFGVTFLAPFVEPDLLEITAARAHVVELFWGAPNPAIVDAMPHYAGYSVDAVHAIRPAREIVAELTRDGAPPPVDVHAKR